LLPAWPLSLLLHHLKQWPLEAEAEAEAEAATAAVAVAMGAAEETAGAMVAGLEAVVTPEATVAARVAVAAALVAQPTGERPLSPPDKRCTRKAALPGIAGLQAMHRATKCRPRGV
jgi:hypothetical protein